MRRRPGALLRERGDPMRANRLLFCTRLLAIVAMTSAAVGCHHGGMHGGHHGFTDDTSTIQVVTTELGGKNVFIPSTIVVTSGHPVKLSIFNTTDVPHGFAIPALNVAEVIPPKTEHEIE